MTWQNSIKCNLSAIFKIAQIPPQNHQCDECNYACSQSNFIQPFFFELQVYHMYIFIRTIET